MKRAPGVAPKRSRVEIELVSRRDVRRWSFYAVCTIAVFVIFYGSALLYRVGGMP